MRFGTYEESSWSYTMNPDLVVIRAGTRWDASMMTDQHLARELARHVKILYVDPVTSPLRRDRRLAAPARLSEVASNVLRLSPPSILRPNRKLTRELGDAALERTVKRCIERAGARRPALIAVEASPLFDSRTFPLRVYWSTDDLVAGASLIGQNASERRRRDERMAREADVVVACSEVLRQRWASIRSDVILIPNGVDADAFRTDPLRPMPRSGEPKAGFVGTIGNRIDFDVLGAVGETGLEVVLVGPLQGTADRRPFDNLLARPNVQWMGFQRFEDLPTLMSGFSVGMTPYGDNPFNRASFPLKTLEYLAAGLPVVSTDLPATRWLDSDLVRIATTPTAFAQQVLEESRREVSHHEREARQRFAETHSWRSRADRWREILHIN
jgi:teichuronic acid biosynthesis glycosyltransferase TuaH